MLQKFRTGLLLCLLAVGGCTNGEFDIRPVFGINGVDRVSASGSPFEAGKLEFEAGRYGLAVKQFQKAVNEEPVSIRALNGLAAAYDKLRRYDLSERIYRSALTLNPASTQTLNNLGYSYLMQGKLDLAATFLREATAHGGKDREINANLRLLEASAARPKPVSLSRNTIAAPSQVIKTKSSSRQRVTQPRMRLVRTAQSTRTLFTQPSIHPIAATFRDPTVSPKFMSGKKLVGIRTNRRKTVTWKSSTIQSKHRTPTEQATKTLPHTKQASIEVSNGTGRSRMASRMRRYLSKKGQRVRWLTNAEHYRKKTTTLFYKPGMKSAAEKVAAVLPVKTRLVARTLQRADLQVELGADLLSFDRNLISSIRKA